MKIEIVKKKLSDKADKYGKKWTVISIKNPDTKSEYAFVNINVFDKEVAEALPETGVVEVDAEYKDVKGKKYLTINGIGEKKEAAEPVKENPKNNRTELLLRLMPNAINVASKTLKQNATQDDLLFATEKALTSLALIIETLTGEKK